jgi:hypothetical protein
MAIPESGSFYVAECLMVVTDPPAPETVTMIEKKITFAVASDASNVWHPTFVHLGTKAIVAMSKKKSFGEFQSLKRIKFYRKPFQSSGRNCSEPCERIHMDIKGPMRVTGIGNYKCFLILVDDFSGFSKAFPLINKSEALKLYKSFCDNAWNLLNKRVT